MQRLEYAPGRTRHLSKRQRIAIILAFVAIVIAFYASRWGAPLWRQSQRLRQQQQRLNFLEPPGTIVYEEHPESAEHLLKDSHYRRFVYGGTIAGPDYNRAVRIPSLVGLSGNQALVFLHRLSSPAGDRIVMLTCGATNAEELGEGRIINFMAMVRTLATWRPESNGQTVSHPRVQIHDLQPGDRVTIYAGQPEPADPSCFTVRFEVNGKPGLLKGKLADDGNSLSLETRME